MRSTARSIGWIFGLALVCAACSESTEEPQDAGGPILPDFGTLGGTDGLDGTAGFDEADGADGEDGTDEPEGGDATDAADQADAVDAVDGDSPLCCETDADCPEDRSACAPVTIEPTEEGQDFTGLGTCQEPAGFPGCVRQADCGPFGECVGVLGCPCDDTACEAQFGLCEVTIPDGCCEDFSNCGAGDICIAKGQYGQCVGLASIPAGRCYNDVTCPGGQECIGATFCDCQEEGCEPELGVCVVPGLAQCQSHADCNGGSCLALEPCAPDCPQGDPTCCYGNQCISQVPECVSDDECSEGPCIAGGTCYSWCPQGDPTCCFGNTCFTPPCQDDNPQGCYLTGCGAGQTCVPSEECIPTSCTCAEDGWQCSSDCLGGVCVESACVGKNPQGCLNTGCAEGNVCQPSDTCVPTSCTCNEALAAWECTNDCGGGVCAPP